VPVEAARGDGVHGGAGGMRLGEALSLRLWVPVTLHTSRHLLILVE
jgi:hypothetical protein